MMNQHSQRLSEKRIGDIVADNYHAAGVFREFGIDFCCGGGRTLADVCKKQQIEPGQVVQKLQQIYETGHPSAQNYNEWSPGFLIDYIENTHHRFVRQKTDEISAYAAKVAKVHGGRHPENVMIYESFVSLSNELLKHLNDEEKTVFPLIRMISSRKEKGKEITPEMRAELDEQLSLMVDDHEGAGEVMAKIRDLSHDFTPPEHACATYRILYMNLAGFEEDLHLHVHLENNILFQKAKQLLAA